ncbi:MAG: hypothetical protein ABS48_01095 [Erythrobacter sp. SCN 68-10]|nr:MAG: hypothetical protein ABS48_01095 [Erythrobacter sp. SCN 68-10]
MLRRMSKSGWFLALPVLCCLQGPALAEEGQDQVPDEPEVLVGGSLTDRELSQHYVRSLGMGPADQQIARWEMPICLSVLVDSEPIAAQMEVRFRAIAEQVGLKVARGKCSPNVMIILAEDASGTVVQLTRRSLISMAEVPRDKQYLMTDDEAPIRWWYNFVVTSRDGDPGFQNFSSSNIKTNTVRQLTRATVVINVPLVTGRAVDSLTDYVALVTLAEIWPDREPRSVGSILDLFKEEPSPDLATGGVSAPRLSAFDRRFLCEVYRMPLARAGQYQRQYLVNMLSAERSSCIR